MEFYQSLGDEDGGNIGIPSHLFQSDYIQVAPSISDIKEIFIDKLLSSLNDVDRIIKTKLKALETLEITTQIINYKIVESREEFKARITDLQDERNHILTSMENKSELSLILNDLDKRILQMEDELDKKIKDLHQDILEYQKQSELLLFQLDEDMTIMQTIFTNLYDEMEARTATMYHAQILVFNQKYLPLIGEFQENYSKYEELQKSGWILEYSQEKLAELLGRQGLKLSPSGKLFTDSGSHVTFEEAQKRGFFDEVTISMDQIFKIFQEQVQPIDLDRPGSISSSKCSKGSTTGSRMASEDVKYLKEKVGKVLTLALAEITAKQPKDPIHYLAHYMFKYRYNQEIEEYEKKEIEELTEQRRILAEERWKKFIEDESRNAVIDMIIKAEEIAYANELRRIEQEMLLAQEEEEEQAEAEQQELNELLEEARDKFE